MKTRPPFDVWQRRVFAIVWATYAGYYMCRYDFGAVQKLIADDCRLSKADLGWILACFSLAYCVGQLISGQLSDRFGPRRVVSVGMFGSSGVSVAFGFANTASVMAVLWALNGVFQSMGFSGCIKTLANWFAPRQRGRAMGIFSLSYKIGNVAAWLLAGWVADRWGWRHAFWVAAVPTFLFGLNYALRTKDTPEEVGLPPVSSSEGIGYLGLRATARRTLGSAAMWMVALSGMLLAVSTYGFLFWLPHFMADWSGSDATRSSLHAMVFPLVGCVGAVVLGWASDVHTGSRRAPVVAVSMILAGVLTLFLPRLLHVLPRMNLLWLGLAGALTMGAHAHIVGTMSMDMGSRQAAASATGFVDSLGYVGAMLTSVVTGQLIGRFGWEAGFYLWGCSALLGAALMCVLWFTRRGA